MVNAEAPLLLQYIRDLEITQWEPPVEVACGRLESEEQFEMARFGRLTMMWPKAVNEEIAQAEQDLRQFPCSAEVVDEAIQFLATGIIANAPAPWVAPGADGGIGIQWDTEGADLYIDIVPGQETTYALTPKTGTPSDGALTIANLVEVLSHVVEKRVRMGVVER